MGRKTLIFSVSGPTEGVNRDVVYKIMDKIERRQANRGKPLSRYISLGFEGVDALVRQYAKDISIEIVEWRPKYYSLNFFKEMLESNSIDGVVLFKTPIDFNRYLSDKKMCILKKCRILEVDFVSKNNKIKYINPSKGYVEAPGRPLGVDRRKIFI